MRFCAGLLLTLMIAGCTSTPKGSPSFLPSTVFEPEGGTTVAQIVAVHGFNDHKTAFTEFASFSSQNAIRLIVFDQQGFGSNDNWGQWAGRDIMLADLSERIRNARKDFPDLPLYVLGESMGGAVSLVTLASEPNLPVDGLILVAPAVWGGEAMNPFYRLVLWITGRIAPAWKFSGKGLGKQASDNIEMLKGLQKDPLFIKGSRVDAIEGLVTLMKEAREDGPKLDLPMLVLGGAKDQIVPPEAHNSFVGTLSPASCTSIVYEQGWHMLLRDNQRQNVFNDIENWMTQTHMTSAGHSDPCGPQKSN